MHFHQPLCAYFKWTLETSSVYVAICKLTDVVLFVVLGSPPS